MKHLFVLFLILMISKAGMGQNIVFEFEKVPRESGFKMDGYWIWGGSMIKVDSLYYLFASRWKKTGPFPEGYRLNSEIVLATSKSPLGPFVFEKVVIQKRDPSFWDSNMSHNPTIHRIGDEFVLFYIGSDFTTYNANSKSLMRRIGYASSKSINGPWKRSDKPLIDSESNNPAILMDDLKVELFYRDENLKVFLLEADNFKGPYKTKNDNLWPDSKLEDFYAFKANNQFHLICEDNIGAVSGHLRWGIHLFSEDGGKRWKKYNPVIVYNHDLLFTDNSVLRCKRRERPQLLIENGEITYLINGVYDGENSWCQPVKLKKSIKIEN